MRLAFLACLICIGASHAALFQARTEPLDLWVDWYPGAEYAGIIAAQDKGWYKEAGIALRLHFREKHVANKVSSGFSSIGLLPAAQLIQDHENGLRLKAFAAHYQFSPDSVIVADKNIVQIEGLKGKRLGIFDEYDKNVFHIILKHVGLKPEDVSFVQLGSDNNIMKYFSQQKVDALLGWEFHWPLTSDKMTPEIKQFPSYRYGYYFYGSVYVAKPLYLKSHADLLSRFIGATRRGWDEVYKNLSLESQRLAKLAQGETRNQLLNLKLSRRFMFDGIPHDSYGQMTHLAWKKSLAIAKAHHFAKPTTQTEDLVDFTVLEKIGRGYK
jgi:ABC-type nitrate/sulfonate/bicarbonate transport system substrate-binding protein